MTRLTITTIAITLCLAGSASAQQEQVLYYHTDAIGSVRMVTDANGQVVEPRHDYLPFGQDWPSSTSSEPRRFTGKEHDQETDFDYSGARYYASSLGRFTTVDPGHVGGDPFDPQTWNAYAYARNNPLRFLDPTGTCSQDTKGNYFDSDGAGTLVATGPCVTTNSGALTAGITTTVTVKSEPSSPGIIAFAEGISVGAGPVADPRFIAGFYGASALGGMALWGVGAFAGGQLATLGPLIPSISQGLTKAAARAAIGGMALSPAQESAALRAVARATTSSSIELVQKGQDLVVRITRAGANGYQVIESIINRAGGKQVIQKAYDAANSLVHYDPK